MTEAQKILDLIETVDPADSEALDEIDARVWCWLNGEEFDFDPKWAKTWRQKNRPQPYTCSRDSLKSIRPEGWKFTVRPVCAVEPWTLRYFCSCCKPVWDKEKNVREDIHHIYDANKSLPTEELAELHAIISAIQYEREEKE